MQQILKAYSVPGIEDIKVSRVRFGFTEFTVRWTDKYAITVECDQFLVRGAKE